MWMVTTPSQRCSENLCMLRSECWRGLIPTLSWLLEDAGQRLAPTPIVFLSGTYWLMGKTKCWPELEIGIYNIFLKLFSVPFPHSLFLSKLSLPWRPLPDQTDPCGCFSRYLIPNPLQAICFQDVHICSCRRCWSWQGRCFRSRSYDSSQGKGIESN